MGYGLLNPFNQMPTVTLNSDQLASELDCSIGGSATEVRRCARMRSASRVLALVAGAVGLLVLCGGWIFDFSAVRSIIPGAASMKANTACGLMLAAAGILLDGSFHTLARRLVPVCATLLILMSLATLMEDISGRSLGIDELLITDRTPRVLVTAPGRMAFITAISFFLLGCALWLRNRPRARTWYHLLAFGAASLCLSNLIGYLYGIDNFAGIAFYTGMAVHTSSSLLILSLSMIFSRPDGGLMSVVVSDYIGGVLVRRLLLAAVLIPVSLGWLTWKAELREMLGSAFGLAILATANVLVFVCLTWIAGKRLNSIDSERSNASASLRAREELLNIFVKHVPAAVAMLDRDMRYLQLSDRWCADYSLQSSQILGRSHYEIVPDLPERWRQIHRRGLAGETLHAEEDRWERADGGTIWLHWEIRPWGSIEGLPKGILIFSEDITRRKQTEDMLRESEATTRALLETAAQAIVAVDSEGLIVIANRMTEDMFGYIRGELLGQAIEILIPHGLRAKHAIRREGYFSNPHNRPMGVGLDLEGLRKDGTTFPLEVSLSAIETNAGKLAVAFVNDITVRKRLEQAEQTHAKEVQALAGGLLRAQEEERRRVSRELHDTICQQLASLAFDIGGLVADSPPPEDTRSRLKTLQARVVKASAETRHIAYALHPSVLDDLGLAACLRSLCNDLSAPPTKVELAFTGNVPAAALPREVASCVYRVAQESLQNIVKHASAKNVSVVLALQDGVVGLTVADDGAGFDPEAIRGKGGLGLIGMQERARLANGKLSIASQPGRGTRIVLEVPLDAASA